MLPCAPREQSDGTNFCGVRWTNTVGSEHLLSQFRSDHGHSLGTTAAHNFTLLLFNVSYFLRSMKCTSASSNY